MANYYGCTRTNYFAVTDPDKLKAIVDRIVWDEGSLGFLAEHDGRWAFGAYACICGLRPDKAGEDQEAEDGCDDEWDTSAVYEALSEVIMPGDAAIITEVGYEKLRYFNAYAVIITRNHVEVEDLRSQALSTAQTLLGDPKYDTRMEY